MSSISEFGYTQDIYGNRMVNRPLYDYFSIDAICRILCRDSVNLYARDGYRFDFSKKCKIKDFGINISIQTARNHNKCTIRFSNGDPRLVLMLYEANARFVTWLKKSGLKFSHRYVDEADSYEYIISRRRAKTDGQIVDLIHDYIKHNLQFVVDTTPPKTRIKMLIGNEVTQIIEI